VQGSGRVVQPELCAAITDGVQTSFVCLSEAHGSLIPLRAGQNCKSIHCMPYMNGHLGIPLPNRLHDMILAILLTLLDWCGEGVRFLHGLLGDYTLGLIGVGEAYTLGLIGVGEAYTLGLIGVGRGLNPAWIARRRHTWLDWCGRSLLTWLDWCGEGFNFCVDC